MQIHSIPSTFKCHPTPSGRRIDRNFMSHLTSGRRTISTSQNPSKRAGPTMTIAAFRLPFLLSVILQAWIPASSFSLYPHVGFSRRGFGISATSPKGDHNDYLTVSSLKTKLLELQQELLQDETFSPPAAAASAGGTGAAAVDLSRQEYAQQCILKRRIPNLGLPDDKIRIGQSTIPNGGRGLFCTRPIHAGEVITCYPGDALVITMNNKNDHYDEDSNLVDSALVWGSHVPAEWQFSDDFNSWSTINNKDHQHPYPPWTGYVVQVCDKYSVLGLPHIDLDLEYAGHFANDSCRARNVKDLSRYVLTSQESANARHQQVIGLHVATVATRKIEPGEEIFVTYGPNYWRDQWTTSQGEVEEDSASTTVDDDDVDDELGCYDESSNNDNGKGFGSSSRGKGFG
jgi:hypothetical protein